MSWYDPRSWPADAAKGTLDQLGKAVDQMGDYVLEHPLEAVVVGLGALGVIGLLNAATTGGKRLGIVGADKVVELTKEEYDID